MCVAVASSAVFPAYAGMSLKKWGLFARRVRFPRLRGDEPEGKPSLVGEAEFSPPTRG